MKIVVIDCSSSKVPDIVKLCNKLGCSTQSIKLENANQQSFDRYDAMIISGGPRLFTDSNQAGDLHQWFGFLTSVSIPIFGICLGHQALGLAAGATVYRDSERRKTELISITASHSLLNKFESSFEMSTDHCEGITLPKGYQLLGNSSCYKVEVMANDKLKRYGVQFHPEVSGNAGEQLLSNFLQLAKG